MNVWSSTPRSHRFFLLGKRMGSHCHLTKRNFVDISDIFQILVRYMLDIDINITSLEFFRNPSHADNGSLQKMGPSRFVQIAAPANSVQTAARKPFASHHRIILSGYIISEESRCGVYGAPGGGLLGLDPTARTEHPDGECVYQRSQTTAWKGLLCT